MYVYTAKSEARAKELNLDERKAGEIAMCGYEYVGNLGTIAKAWLEKGYIIDKD